MDQSVRAREGGGGGLRPPLPQTSWSNGLLPLWFVSGSGLGDGVLQGLLALDHRGMLGPHGGQLSVDQTPSSPTSGVPRRGFRKNPFGDLIVST